MTNKITWYLMLVAVALIALPALVSCNKDKDKDDDTFTYSTSRQTTLIKAFGLQADADVLSSLDSVHFTVDYDRGLIYNADSLPVGTDILLKLPYQNLGFSLVGFTMFHFLRFQILHHYSTFITTLIISKDLDYFIAVSICYLWLFFPIARTLKASQLLRAWTFLYIIKI